MRSRSNSGVRLDFYQRMIQKTILKYLNPVTGLIPATPSHPHAWVRDNVYSILAVWGLALAYRKNADLDEDRAKAYELEQSVVKLMRGLLFSMMKQMDKVEKFKYTQSPHDALHAKYSVTTGKTVVGDDEWGHLQVDATSIYLLILAEMTASGLNIVYTLDEVAFIQNLVFYIQSAYRTPDYGIWERGDKTNHGLPELNASSIGMAKAALEALNELDLFGAQGGPSSVIHVMPDEAAQCQAILDSLLPRESQSKETDAGLLSVISYPAFACDDQELIDLTRETVCSKLQGRYGLCRFLRDGYKTPKEDPHRLHYEPWELQVFENIECEWPMFYAYLILDGLFKGDPEQVEEYTEQLEDIMIKREDGLRIMPELFSVPMDKVELEYSNPKSQDRTMMGKIPQMWGQSLYVLGKLLKEGFLSPGELDPLNRRLTAEPKPDIVVQMVIVAEDDSIREKLGYYDIHVQTMSEIRDVQLYPARVLSHLFSHLGKNSKLGLTGRPSEIMGVIATAKVYNLGTQTLVFYPQFVDQQQFYLPLDTSLLVDMVKTEIQYLGSNWKMMGRPVMVLPIRKSLLDLNNSLHPALVSTLKKLKTGYINGTRVHLGLLKDFINTSCVSNLTFLTEADDSPDLSKLLKYISRIGSTKGGSSHLLTFDPRRKSTFSTRVRRRSSVKGIIKRTCSIVIDPNEIPDLSHLLPPGVAANMGLSVPQSPGMTRVSSGLDFTASSEVSSGSTSPTTSVPSSPGVNTLPGNAYFPDGQHHPHLKGDSSDENLLAHHETLNQYSGIDCNELVEQLRETEALHEQADIIHYLFINKGPDWDTKMEGRSGCTVRALLSELYDKAGHLKQWWLVRHTAGMLNKKVEDLAKAATDILVRQKQLAVGLPPEPREKIITRPLPPDELSHIIHEACGDDTSTAMLTMEVMVYLAMFIRTEPKLFNEMLRIRVGLIIQVMASEMSRALRSSGEEASDQLLNLSPCEMKNLLHHILSGNEFDVSSDLIYRSGEVQLTIQPVEDKRGRSRHSSGGKLPRNKSIDELEMERSEELEEDADRQGQWLRRRRLDGALNRVPVGFYEQIWGVLNRCHGLKFENHPLPNSVTKEMTAGEIKFALQVEMFLNRIPQPEYRQLMVECMMVLCLVVENDHGKSRWEQCINIEQIVHRANEVFIAEQTKLDGDVTLCCGMSGARPSPLKCGGTAGICQNFYDTAPSGRYGTMSYICRATAELLHFPTCPDGNLDCVVS